MPEPTCRLNQRKRSVDKDRLREEQIDPGNASSQRFGPRRRMGRLPATTPHHRQGLELDNLEHWKELAGLVHVKFRAEGYGINDSAEKTRYEPCAATSSTAAVGIDQRISSANSFSWAAAVARKPRHYPIQLSAC